MSPAVHTLTLEIPALMQHDLEPYFRAHDGRLVRALTLISGSEEAAADAVQEAFVKAHLKRRSGSGSPGNGDSPMPCRIPPCVAVRSPAPSSVPPVRWRW